MPAERTPGGFGSKLRDARERKGISLRQIANATKISVSALEALERNDVSRLPGGIFSRAFVRSYAVEVGLDPEQTIQDFIAQFPHDSVTAGHPHSEQVEDNEALESDRRMATAFLRLLVVSLPVAGVVVYFSLSGRPAADARAAAAAGNKKPIPAVVPAPAADVVPAATPVARAADPPAPLDRLTVGVTATAPCWVVATLDGNKVLERQLQAGEHSTFDVRRELSLTAGNAGALALTLNGAAARPLGKAGDVVTIRLTMTNFQEYIAKQ
jgi:cytoskeleton protein RodZ